MHMEKTKILYIAGYGRSGSTVLDTVLGAHPEVESVGELINAPRALFNPIEYCACGKPVGDCDFWSAVHDEWKKLSGCVDMSVLDSLQHRYECGRRLPLIWLARLLKTRGYGRYLHAEQALYKAIASLSGKRFVVDSSKSPMRAFALSKMLGFDFYVIHLVRDGRGVAWSLMKPIKKDPKAGVQRDLKAKPAWRTALFWVQTNVLAELLIGRVLRSKMIRIRYEDFVEKPGSTLKKIGDLIGVDYRCVEKKLVEEQELPVGHTVAGNRARMAGVIKLNADYTWKKRLPKKDNRWFWNIAWPLAVRYGYKRNSDA